LKVYVTFPLEKGAPDGKFPPETNAVESFHRWVISARSIPFGIKVVGVIRYQFFISPGVVYGLTLPLHIPSNVIAEAHSSSVSHGEFLYFTVLTTRSLGVVALAAFPEILEIDTLIKSTSGIFSLAI
jgi:hypothetical protein